MARRAVGDEDHVYRAVVATKRQHKNKLYWDLTPEEQKNTTEAPYYTTDDPKDVLREYQGPYGTIGQARAQATSMAQNKARYTRELFVEKYVEKAKIEWSRVE